MEPEKSKKGRRMQGKIARKPLRSTIIVFLLGFSILNACAPYANASSGVEITTEATVGLWAQYTHNASSTAFLLNIVSMNFTVIGVSGTNVTINAAANFVNGTQRIETFWVDVTTGNGTATFMIIPPGLNVGDSIYTNYPSFQINGTTTKTYAGQPREVVYMTSQSYGGVEMVWDRATGFITEFTSCANSDDWTSERVTTTLNQTNIWSTGLAGPKDFMKSESSNPPVNVLSAGWESATNRKTQDVENQLGMWLGDLYVISEVQAYWDGSKYTAVRGGDKCIAGKDWLWWGRILGWGVSGDSHDGEGITGDGLEAWHQHKGEFTHSYFYIGVVDQTTIRVTATVSHTVGGVVVPVDRFVLLAPYIGLALAILAALVASTVYVKRVKPRKDKQ